MKKLFLGVFIFIMLFIRVNASTYSCNLTGDNVLHPFDEDHSNYFFIGNMKINIDNIEELSSFDITVEYDKDLIGVFGCNLLNKETSNCSIKNNKIVYSYKYSSKYDFNNYDLYTVSFISNYKTPDTGSTNIKVSFDNIKDKNKNLVSIEPCNYTFEFKEIGDYAVPSENTNEDIKYDKLDIDIKGYNIDFKEDTYEYSINVDSEVNSLDINVKLDEKSEKYTITGASDLNSYGNKVSIIITNVDGEEIEYKINVIKEKKEIVKEDIKVSFKEFLNKNKNYFIIVIGLILILIIILFVVRKIKSRKIDKYLKDL